MTPHYEEAGSTIYHGDALDVLDKLCEIAAKRLSQGVLDLSQPEPPEPTPEPQQGVPLKE